MSRLSPVLVAALLLGAGCASPDVDIPARGIPSPTPAFRRSGKGECSVPAVNRPVQVDGRLDPEEWNGLDPSAALRLTKTHDLETAKQPSEVWLVRDRLSLYVAVRSRIDPSQRIRPKSVWGENDGVELAFRRPGDASATTFILRGYPCMRFQSLTQGGATPKQIEAMSDGVSIRAKYNARQGYWTMEWRIALRAIGLSPKDSREVAFNVTVCKPGSQEMVCWRPSTAETWRLDGKGILELAPQPPPRRIMVPGLAPTPD